MKPHIKLFTIAFAFAALIFFSAWIDKEDEKHSDQLLNLVEQMTGSFNSSEQAINDSTYYDITLHMYRIWEGTDDIYLYVEQAVTSDPEKPYRQRVYKVVEIEPGSYESIIYKIENESEFINKWQEPSYFDKYDQGILQEREGCSVSLQRNAFGDFEGSTDGTACKSTLRGASFATSKVMISENIIESWDQGFDDTGVQVWGATSGPYIFKRIEN